MVYLGMISLETEMFQVSEGAASRVWHWESFEKVKNFCLKLAFKAKNNVQTFTIPNLDYDSSSSWSNLYWFGYEFQSLLQCLFPPDSKQPLPPDFKQMVTEKGLRLTYSSLSIKTLELSEDVYQNLLQNCFSFILFCSLWSPAVLVYHLTQDGVTLQVCCSGIRGQPCRCSLQRLVGECAWYTS